MRRADFTREEFEKAAGDNLSAERWYKPEVRLAELGGQKYCVKDFRRRIAFWRWTAGWLVIAREARIYRALSDLPGIPRFFGRLDRVSIVTEYIEGTDISTFKKGTLPEGLLDRLADLISSMHDQGVVHCDLRQRKNVIVGRDGEPWLIDFASGFRLRPGSRLLRIISWFDRSGVAKLRLKHDPESLTDRDRGMLRLDWFRPLRRFRKARRAKRKAARRAARDAAREKERS